MSMKLSRKFVIGVVINLPKYFASQFGHLTLKQLLRLYPLLKNVEHLYSNILKTFGINTFSTTVPTECRLLMWHSVFTYFPQLFIALNVLT